MVEVIVSERKRADCVGLSRVCSDPTLYWVSAEGFEWYCVEGV